MPRKKKPSPEMQDRELFESLFPKPIRDRVEDEVELDVPEKKGEKRKKRPIKRQGS